MQMNRGLSYVMTSTLGIVVGLLAGEAPRMPRTAVNSARETDAAFCDGEFEAKLDVDNGRKPRIQSERWMRDGDRALFIAGYQQAYRQLAANRPERIKPLNAAELAGYRDGMRDGERQRKAMQPSRVTRTELFLNAGQVSTKAEVVSESYKRDYRLGYANGYQVGYYSKAEKEE
jgi:hypothetical protein